MFALDGLNPRQWSAADRCSVTFYLLKRQLEGPELRSLHELVGDKDAVAAFDRKNMGQGKTIEVANIPGRRTNG